MQPQVKAQKEMLEELIRQMDEDEAKGYDMDEEMDGDEMSDELGDAAEETDEDLSEDDGEGYDEDDDDDDGALSDLDEDGDCEKCDGEGCPACDAKELSEEDKFSDEISSFMKDKPEQSSEGAMVVKRSFAGNKKGKGKDGKKSGKKFRKVS